MNPFTGKLTLLVEPRFGDSEDWYLFADPATLPTMAHAYLLGCSGCPEIQRQEACEHIWGSASVRSSTSAAPGPIGAACRRLLADG